MRLLLLTALVSVVATYISCKKSDDPGETETPAQTLKNVSYGSNAQQKMDIYLPANRNTSSTKVLIAIHGGGWAVGDKSEMDAHIDSMLKRLPGYAVFNINYRLAAGGLNLFPSANNDVHEAINFILSKKSEYKVSDKLSLLGVSSGGHLALMEAYGNNALRNIKAVVAAFAPADLADLWNNPAGLPANTRLVLTNYLGTTLTANPSLYGQASPINIVTAQSAPTQLFHATGDTVVPYQQSVLLRN
ncbi:MAG: alpha/beta hydrolase, partial [Dinghuibacter sp.]|nr:alpha/beta hydrolase [Dinghuibacter sp.]